MVALETQTISQEVPQLVIAGEVDDGGRYSHNPAHRHKQQVSNEYVHTVHCVSSTAGFIIVFYSAVLPLYSCGGGSSCFKHLILKE